MKITTTVLALFTVLGLAAQLPEALDEVAPFSEDLAAIRKGNDWAFIDDLGTIVIDFRSDIHWNPSAKETSKGVNAVRQPKFSDGLCMVRTYVDDIAVYGFINTKGELVIEHQFLNVHPFKNGFTTGVIYEKVFRGRNEFKLDIYEHKFHEVLMDASGKIIEFLGRRYNIQMKKSRYKLPTVSARLLNDQLVAVKIKNDWAIKKINL
ncbi:WG repeat-containing protein [uncultured Croceitalea sp.]|uniref:WG repeat-containing protein n=1 Tax=uncultured Croceitalea sp. TaxID=1798908 RepID=UPI003306426C